MVKAEDKKNPLSDQEIVARLQAEGVDIARRTVAKYREKLNIPSSRQRKEY
jgi:RNA polymerase sigma-54 factor